MVNKRSAFIQYLNANSSRTSIRPIHPGIEAILNGEFNRLPENPSRNDWQAFALMIDGYELSEKLELGGLSSFVFNKCLPEFYASGKLPDKLIEQWICLFSLQRQEKMTGYPLDANSGEIAQ